MLGILSGVLPQIASTAVVGVGSVTGLYGALRVMNMPLKAKCRQELRALAPTVSPALCQYHNELVQPLLRLHKAVDDAEDVQNAFQRWHMLLQSIDNCLHDGSVAYSIQDSELDAMDHTLFRQHDENIRDAIVEFIKSCDIHTIPVTSPTSYPELDGDTTCRLPIDKEWRRAILDIMGFMGTFVKNVDHHLDRAIVHATRRLQKEL